MVYPVDIASGNQISRECLKEAIDVCIKITDFNMFKFMGRYPAESARNGIYNYLNDGKGSGWLGFWGGIVWLSYLVTGEQKTRFYGKQLTKYICSLLKEELFHSDLGLLVMPSCVADYKVTGSESALSAVILAARSLLEKYNAKSGIICSTRSDNLNDEPNYKISNLLNIQVLVQANKFMGDDIFGSVAKKNLQLICDNNIREDGRTGFRVYVGKKPFGQQPDFQETRAYAWALYGMVVCYATTKDVSYVNIFDKVYRYLQNHKKAAFYYEYLEDASPEARADSTSAAIIAAALTELLKNKELHNREVSGTETCGSYYQRELTVLLQTLIRDYAAKADGHSEGLLLGSEVLGSPQHRSTSTLCGDYFYLEALLNHYMDVESFWYVS